MAVTEINIAPKIKNKMLKIMNIYYRTVFVLFGLDFGFFRHKKVPVKFLTLYSLIYCLILNVSIYCIFIFRNFWQLIWFFSEVIKFNFFKFRLLYLKDERSFFNFHKEIFLADLKSGIDNTSFNLELKILGFSLIWTFGKLVLHAVYGPNSSQLAPPPASILLLRLTQEFSKIHRSVCDTYYKLIITLCCNIPEVMISFYYTLVEWRYHIVNMDDFSLKSQYIFLSLAFVITMIPAICAGMLSSQVKQIKLILHEKLMQNRDEATVWEIRRFIRYVEARGCQFSVYKLIPLDASLVGMVFSFCVTYLIVIIQFTKLY